MMVDTDVLIWASRGNERAVVALARLAGFRISVVTYAEILEGVRDREELRNIQTALRLWRVSILHISEAVSQRAMFFVEQFALSHSVHLADALVAATAIHHGETLLTANVRHFSVLPGLDTRRFVPGR